MLRKETISIELLKVLEQVMQLESLRQFRLVGGTALALQLGHRESVDIDLFPAGDFQTEAIYNELAGKFRPLEGVFVTKDVMITLSINGVKVDIVNEKNKFIRSAVVEEGIRMAHLDDIAAMKIKATCDPFYGRKTQKDLADIATLLDRYSIREMLGFVRERYPTMAPYTENLITQLNKDFDLAAQKSKMPKMLNGLTWGKTQEKIQIRLREFFDELLRESEERLKSKQ